MERYTEYKLEEEISTKIACHSDNYTIVAFSAEWCPDCYRNIPVLAHIQEKTGLKTRVFGGLMRDAFMRGLTELIAQDDNVILLTADLGFGVFEPMLNCS